MINDDRTERRGTIRESNEKLDEAINHLTSAIEHIKVSDEKRTFQDRISGLRTAFIVASTVLWVALISISAALFIQEREIAKLTTDLRVSELKIKSLELIHR